MGTVNIITKTIELTTNGFSEIHNITESLKKLLAETGLQEGQVVISAIGSTTGITTLEYEPGLVQSDVGEMLDQLAPYGKNYRHNQTWHDDNGAAHLRSCLIGTSYTCPFSGGKLLIGTWQQVVFLDFDTRARSRSIIAQVWGI